MRIIAGEYKGRKYNGKVPAGVRPTLDNVRETIFNVVSNYISFNGINVADICAGTGAMGYEALSRGADHCVFIEKNRKVAEFIKEVGKAIKVEESKYKILIGDALKVLAKLNETGEPGTGVGGRGSGAGDSESGIGYRVSGMPNENFDDEPKSSIVNLKFKIPFDLVFIDPPYQLKIINPIIETLVKYELLTEDALIVAELSFKDTLILPEGLMIINEKVIGDTKVCFINQK